MSNIILFIVIVGYFIIRPQLQYQKVDFREAIFEHNIRISINELEIDENQRLILRAQPTWIIGVFYNDRWNKVVILRDGKYKKIINTPYSVKVDGSIGLLIPKQKLSIEKMPEDKKQLNLLQVLIIIITIFIVVKYIFLKLSIRRK